MARTTVVFGALILVAFAATAHAQDEDRVGVTMGYPASFGVLWRVSDRVAIRPEVTFSTGNSTSTSVITIVSGGPGGSTTTSVTTQSVNDSTTFTVGASGLFYIARWDALRTYLSPRSAYGRGTTTSFTSSTQAVSPQPSVEFTNTSYLASGSFGAEYALGRRFAVFGEIGVAYTRLTTTSAQPGAGNTTGYTVASRSGAGVIVFFR
jgi:hypothetical protein